MFMTCNIFNLFLHLKIPFIVCVPINNAELSKQALKNHKSSFHSGNANGILCAIRVMALQSLSFYCSL